MNLPKEFEEKMKTLLGSEYEEYTACYDEPRHYGLRVNTAKISVEDFLKIARRQDRGHHRHQGKDHGRWSRFRGLRMDFTMTEIISSLLSTHIILQDFTICRNQVP